MLRVSEMCFAHSKHITNATSWTINMSHLRCEACADFGKDNLLFRRYLSAALSATGGKALAAQNGPARLGLERNTVTLPALIANNLESFPLAATAASSALPGAAKVGAPRVAAWLAALRMSQSTFAIIVLLSFSKRKG